MLRKMARLLGAILLLVGILGFVPGITTDSPEGGGLLLGIFHVDALHNIIHIASGLAGLLASSSAAASRTYFKVFGIIYTLVALAGFMPGLTTEDDKLLGLFHVNLADNLLHVAIAAFSLYFGFVHRDNEVDSTERPAGV